MNENDFIKFYREQETNSIRMLPYKDDISEIVEYIQKKISDNITQEFDNMRISIRDSITLTEDERKQIDTPISKNFYISKDLASKIDFIENLSIFVEYEYYDNGFLLNKKNLDYIHHFNDIDFIPEIRLTKDGKIEKAEITIKCLFDYNSNKLFSRSTYNNLFHEINHLYSVWKELFDNRKMENVIRKAYRAISLYIDEMNDIKETEKSGIVKRM